jgi:hypothetical protein
VRVIQGFQSEDDPPEVPYAGRSGGSVGVGVVVVADSPAPVLAPRPQPRPNSAAAKSDKAYVYLILAAALGITPAVTEGARYDGWVALHPMHPVHLLGPNGEYTPGPLAHLDPQTAMWARKAIVRPGEGPWQTLERRPPSRRGLTYSMTLGYAEMPSELGSEERGVLGHITFGYFPSRPSASDSTSAWAGPTTTTATPSSTRATWASSSSCPGRRQAARRRLRPGRRRWPLRGRRPRRFHLAA